MPRQLKETQAEVLIVHYVVRRQRSLDRPGGLYSDTEKLEIIELVDDVQRLWPYSLIKITPSIKRGSRDSDLLQHPPNRQMGLLHEPDDLQLY